MALPPPLRDTLRLPAIGAPLFLVSNPDLVIAQCKAGIVGSFPALNARPPSMLDEWLHRITEELQAWDRDHPDEPAAPFAVNQIVHKSNQRLEGDVALTQKWKAPIVITSLGAREDVNHAVHAYGGLTLHDVINDRHAHKAVEKGADGLIAVAAGAGGHAGAMSPFALVQDIRAWFDGPLALSGAIARGAAILAAEVMGADLAYIGSAFIATKEANAAEGHKQAIVEGRGEDILGTKYFTGVFGNYLRSSIVNAGLDPDHLPEGDPQTIMAITSDGSKPKAWRDIWGSGQGIGAVRSVTTAGELVARLSREYAEARAGVVASAQAERGQRGAQLAVKRPVRA
jgi:nitronate monooxygenase